MSVIGSNVLAGASGQAAGYEIERSLRFNDSDSAYLGKNFSSAGNRRTWSFACWVKRSELGTTDDLFNAGGNSTQPRTEMRFKADDTFTIGFSPTGSSWYSATTSAVFRDPSAWYHIVVACDTTQSTSSDRLKLYVNGALQTFASASYVPQNTETPISDSTYPHSIGRYQSGGSAYLDGYLADVHFIDGQALAPTDFGEYDDNGVWQPKAYSGTYGTNGFHLDFSDNSSNAALGDDSSGNNNDWTVNNLLASSTPNAIEFPSGVSNVDYLVVAGGGGGGGDLSGGGGAGGVLSASSYSVTSSTAYQVQVGLGGSGNTGNSAGSNGENSRFGSVIASGGGGGGGDNGVPGTGGSGGGGSTGGADSNARTGAAGTASQGNAGGNGFGYPGGPGGGGGGGAAGSNGTTDDGTGGDGGIGIASSITGTSVYYGGGGGGGRDTRLTGSAGTGGLGGGGNGGDGGAGANGTANTGGGGGGGSQSGGDGGNGGSGVVIVRYPDTFADLSFIGSSLTYTKTTTGGYKIYSFTASTSELSDPDGDSLIDTPTNYEAAVGNAGGNYATLNPLDKGSSITLSNGSLDYAGGASNHTVRSTIQPKSGKWYWEASGDSNTILGISASSDLATTYPGESASSRGYFAGGSSIIGGSVVATWATYTSSDTIGFALDVDAGTCAVYKNNSLQGTWTGLTNPVPAIGRNSGIASINFGQRPFAYTPPTGYKSLCTTNLADPTIADGSTAMDVALYTGNGSTQTISGLGFSPDLVWIKERNGDVSHQLYDGVRGATKKLSSNTADAEATTSTGLTSFDSTGFSLGSYSSVNNSSDTYVAWAWDGGTSTVSNTDGSITSSVRASQTNGCSIVSYTGDITANQTIGHGLGAAPSLMILKCRSNADGWPVYHASLGNTNYLRLESSAGQVSTSPVFNSTSPTSSVFTVGQTGLVNETGRTYVAYCFAPVEGYSAFGSYTGNGLADGPFIYTGFRPAFVIQKRTNSTGNWRIRDTKRSTYNAIEDVLYADTSSSTITEDPYDFLSNGFKIRTSGPHNNASGGSYIYLAFAENPLKYARAR